MGTKIADPILARAIDILEAYPALGKKREEGAILATNTDEDMPAVASAELLSQLSSGEALDKPSLSELIICLDLLASGLPDNDKRMFDPEIQHIGGKLRQRFSKLYGGSPYPKH